MSIKKTTIGFDEEALKAKIARVRFLANQVESIKGAPLPKGIIEALCALQKARPDLDMRIGSNHDLVRNLNFFRKYCSSLRFFDRTGKEFQFTGKARSVIHNEMFVAVSISEKYRRMTVYARYPGEP